MSRWYRTIDAGIWGDEKFRRLTRPQPNGQSLWVYILTGEHTEGLPGLYRLGEAALAEALGWSVEDLRPAFAELEAAGMVMADREARVVYLPNALKYQAPNNPKHLKGLANAFDRIPECHLKRLWLEQITEWAHTKGDDYVESLHTGFDTVTHTVSMTVSETVTGSVSPSNSHSDPHPQPKKEFAARVDEHGAEPVAGDEIPYTEIVGYLNDRSGKRYRHTAEITRRHIRARWREGHQLAEFKAVIDAKCASWLGKKMELYLRPETLFGPKFEGYLNERCPGDAPDHQIYQDISQVMEESCER